MNNRPVAKQLLNSLLNYMDTENFNPSKTIEMNSLEGIRLKGEKDSFSTTDIYN